MKEQDPDGPPAPHPKPRPEKPPIGTGRIAIWVVVGAIGLYLVASGVYQMLTK